MFGLSPIKRNHDLRDALSFRKFMDSFFDDRGFFSLMNNEYSNFKVDIKENEREYLIEAELPGFKKEDINLKVEEDHLLISVSSNEEKAEERENYICKERRTGSYMRSFRLNGINKDGVTANYKDGVLNVRLPKDENARPNTRNIEIH